MNKNKKSYCLNIKSDLVWGSNFYDYFFKSGMNRSNKWNSIVKSDFFLFNINKRLMVFKSHHDVSNSGVISCPLGESVIVSPKRRRIDVSNILGDNQRLVWNLRKEFDHLLIKLHHHWKTSKDSPSFQFVIVILINKSMLSRLRR